MEQIRGKIGQFRGILQICLNFAAPRPLEISKVLHKRENAKYISNEVAVDEHNENVFSNQRVKSDKKKHL